MNRVIHFDIYADDLKRAKKFYEQAFGWKFEKWEGEGMKYWLITTGPDSEPGINGGMAMREKEMKKAASVWSITIGVENIDEALKKVEKADGKITMKKMGLPNVGWFANFKDPEGNIISLMQADMSAE
jgi:uncharacterized protein